MTQPALPILTVDGTRFDDFAGFVREFSDLLEGFEWHGSLDAFNDILRGGCGTPDGGFVLRWRDSERSRQALGWQATISWLESSLLTCHPTNRADLRARVERAQRSEGTTLFDWLVDIIEVHGPGGREAEDEVHLELR